MYVLIFILGLCFGSFVNMLVYRTAKQYGILKNKNVDIKSNRSFCDYCGKQLKWYENIPVVSWLFLRGETKCCHKKLPVSYPVVELMMGIIFIINFQFLISNNQLNWFSVLSSLIILTLMVYIAVYDAKTMYIPDWSNYLLIGIALVGVIFDERNIIPYLLAAFGAGLFLFLISLIKIKGVSGMGMGDVLLAVFMGLFLGYPKIIVAFYVAFVVGAIYGIGLIIFKKVNKENQVPFGPFLILGTLIAWWWGEKILNLIYSIS